MSAQQARAFLLKAESYCRIELPPYFDFSGVLRPIAKHLTATPLTNSTRARNCVDVNYTVYSNKDGRYAWRPFQLIHPVLYVDLVQKLTEPAAWTEIVARFAEFDQDARIRCLSIPVTSRSKRSDRATQILHWWHEVEQASISEALDFSFVLHADVTDCYSSIYTHSVAWALHGKDVAKQRRRDYSLLGNMLDGRVQDMRHGQTNGIPQGSALVDLIAELVLGYADLELSRRLAEANIRLFKILRYRDDYRVFVNDTQTGEVVLKTLTEVLMNLGLKLNASKTTGFRTVIEASVKSDKRAWMQARQEDGNLQKHLLLIHAHGVEFPNAGSLIGALDDFYKRIARLRVVDGAVQLISIAVDIGYASPRCFPVCAAIVSKLLSTVRPKQQKMAIVERIQRKLSQLPNNGHLELWLQRISYALDPSLEFSDPLCRVVAGRSEELWNSDWIEDATLKMLVDSSKVVGRRRLKAVRAVVPRSEFTPFASY